MEFIQSVIFTQINQYIQWIASIVLLNEFTIARIR